MSTQWEWSVRDVLNDCGAISPAAIQVGGKWLNDRAGGFSSHPCVSRTYHRRAFTVFSDQRNLCRLWIIICVFVEESCGYCTPCRVGNVFLKRAWKNPQGQAEKSRYRAVERVEPNHYSDQSLRFGTHLTQSVLSSLEKFPMVYAALLKESTDGFQASFDIQDALEESRRLAKRRSLIYDTRYGDKG